MCAGRAGGDSVRRKPRRGGARACPVVGLACLWGTRYILGAALARSCDRVRGRRSSCHLGGTSRSAAKGVCSLCDILEGKEGIPFVILEGKEGIPL